MQFLLGIVVGILLSLLVVATLTYFRYGIEKRVMVIERKISSAGPRPKGYIVEPADPNEELREEIIKRNRSLGRDTHISELT